MAHAQDPQEAVETTMTNPETAEDSAAPTEIKASGTGTDPLASLSQEGPSEAAVMSLLAIGNEKKDGVKRRSFLKWGGVGLIGAGLVVGVAYPRRFEIIMRVQDYLSNRNYDPNAFIMVSKKGPIKLVCHRSEMGQGIRAGIIMLLAEELEVSLDQIEIIQGTGDPKYGNQNTDGSRSIRTFYERLRTAAAHTRELLRKAAAVRWSVHPSECEAKAGKIIHAKSQRSASYQELAGQASRLTLAHTPALKPFNKFKIIGKPQRGVDVAAFAQGKATFGIDVELPDMLYACALRAPIPDARLKAVNAKVAKKVRGVQQIVKLEQAKIASVVNDSVCVIATNTWAAMKGKEALQAEWDFSKCMRHNSAEYSQTLAKAFDADTTVYRNDGDVKAAEKQGKPIEAVYRAPFLVHAPMEPLVCVAHVQAGVCEVWAPTQDPQRARKAVASLLGIKADKVTMNVTYLGGGFGRKSQPDFILEAVALSQKVGKPIKMQWTREDEIKHGFYHAQSHQRLVATLDEKGDPISWRHQSVFPTIMANFLPGSRTPAAWELGMGATNIPYRIPNVLCEAGNTETPVRVAWLRSVCNIWHAFAVNSFVDELAATAKVDSLAYRYRLIGPARVLDPGADYPQDTARLLKVMRATEDVFGWDKPLPKGHGKGFASHFSFFSYVAVAIEASNIDGVIKVHRAVCTIDCGLAVNPESVRAQIEGSVVFGLSAAMYGKITLKDGIVEQSNFHDYPLLRMPEMPKVEVIIINGDPAKPAGVGEPGVPPVAPALAAALFNATGKRFRDMPFIEHA